jgi:hypothetical protein
MWRFKLKKIQEKPNVFHLEKLTIKEIMKKYPDKVVDVYAEGKDAILVLDTCRIRFTNQTIAENKQ